MDHGSMAIKYNSVLQVNIQGFSEVDADQGHCAQSHCDFLLVDKSLNGFHTLSIAIFDDHPEF